MRKRNSVLNPAGPIGSQPEPNRAGLADRPRGRPNHAGLADRPRRKVGCANFCNALKGPLATGPFSRKDQQAPNSSWSTGRKALSSFYINLSPNYRKVERARRKHFVAFPVPTDNPFDQFFYKLDERTGRTLVAEGTWLP